MARPEDDIDIGRSQSMPEEMPEFDGMAGDAKITRRGDRAVVDFNPGMSRVSQDDGDDHSRNLIDDLDASEASDLANDIIEWVDADEEARADWMRRMEQGMELMGLNNIPMEELAFDGASSVTFPLIGEAVVQFQARAIEEVFPSEGPVKTKVVGEFTQETEEQADRIKNHMNYQILDQDRSYFWHTDQMLFYLPIVGSAFKKTYYCSVQKMVVSRFIQPEDFIVPYIASDLASSPRYTHRMWKNESEMKKLIASGFYGEMELTKTSIWNRDKDSVDYQDQADDRSPELSHKDTMYELLECHCDLELEFDQERYGVDHPLPYIVTVERETREVIGVRRNWKEQDTIRRKRIWFTHYKYLPGLGFYGFGLLHMIGSLAESTSGAIRALLDSAAFANMQGGFVSADAKLQAGDHHITPGEWKEVNMTAEELQRAFYTPPFKGPEPAMAQLLELLIDAGKSFSNSTEVMTGEANNNAPVGTTIALIEQSSKPLSAIHRRLHMAAAEEFKLRSELNYEFLPPEYPYKIADQESTVMRQDYDGRVDVIPISDPNIFSSTQRIAQGQALVQLANENPDLYNRREAHERFLKAIRIPDYEEVMQSEPQPVRLDPVQENMGMLQGQGANAFIDQDHDAHIAVHMNYLNGLNEEAIEMMGPIMQAHMAEHFSYKYYVEMQRQLGGQLPQPGQFGPDQPLDPQMDAQISQMAAQVPQIEIMPPSDDEDDFERDQARLDDEHEREQVRKDEMVLAEIERQEMVAMNQAQRDDFMAKRKEAREDRANQAKIERENKLAAAKAATQRKAQPSG